MSTILSENKTNHSNSTDEELDLLLILIYGAPQLHSTDGVPGLHVHAVDRKLYEQQQNEQDVTYSAKTAIKIPEKTMLLHGNISDLFKGDFATGLAGIDARKFGINSIAIASTNVKSGPKGALEKPVVNNEAVAIGGVGICTGNDGVGRGIADNEEFAYFQVINAADEFRSYKKLQFKNEHTLLTFLQKNAHATQEQSFAALVPAKVKKSGINLKTIDGFNADGSARETFKIVLREHRQWTADANEGAMPGVAHVNSLNFTNAENAITIESDTDIKFAIIDRLYVNDRVISEQKEQKLPTHPKAAASHIQIGNRIYRESKLHPDLQKKLAQGADILGVKTTDADGKPLQGVTHMVNWENKIEPKAAETLQARWREKMKSRANKTSDPNIASANTGKSR